MRKILAYFNFNIKILLKDKISILWSILMPTIFLLINNYEFLNLIDLRYWWSYIITTSYIYGIGLFIITQREYGNLKMFFSIEPRIRYFFIANIITQILYSFICIFIFNIICSILYKFSFLKMILYSLKLIVMLIPIGFLGCLFILLKNITISSINTITNVIIFILFTLLSRNLFNKYNPLYLFSNVIIIKSINEFIIYIFISSIMILIGLISLKKFTPISINMR